MDWLENFFRELGSTVGQYSGKSGELSPAEWTALFAELGEVSWRTLFEDAPEWVELAQPCLETAVCHNCFHSAICGENNEKRVFKPTQTQWTSYFAEIGVSAGRGEVVNWVQLGTAAWNGMGGTRSHAGRWCPGCGVADLECRHVVMPAVNEVELDSRIEAVFGDYFTAVETTAEVGHESGFTPELAAQLESFPLVVVIVGARLGIRLFKGSLK